jgi:hypothetical protein
MNAYLAMMRVEMAKLNKPIKDISKQTGMEVTFTRNDCFQNALTNKDLAYKNLNLHLVIGSLGFNGWFEFGGKDWETLDDWKAKGSKGGGSWDAHGWLEDDEGNVYDYVFDEYLEIADMRNGRGKMTAGLVERLSKKNAEKRRGLTYIPASAEVQAYILADLRKYGRC